MVKTPRRARTASAGGRARRRIVGLWLAGLLVLAGPVPAAAQAVQVVTAVAQYVGLTAAFAEALDVLARAVAQTYASGRGIADDVACRSQKQALEELVIALRKLEREKHFLHTSLVRNIRFEQGSDWGDVRTQAERVKRGLRAIQAQIAANEAAFAGSRAMSRAYGDLLISFDAKEQLVDDLMARLDGIDWDWSGVRARDLDPHLGELEKLEASLAREIEAIGEATGVIAEHTGSLCARAAG